jgi:predicted Rossmann fold flavoprotein
VVATGGLSWPQLGSTDLGYRLARQFDLKVIEPSPALVGLTFPEKEQARFEGLSGIHLRVGAACGKWSLVEDLMITHQGLSGPAILNASLHWNPGMELTVDWIPAETMEATLARLRKDPAGSKPWLREALPRRLADRLMHHAGAKGNWKDLPQEKLKTLAETLHAYRFVPSGTFGYRMAEVTRGGVDTREVNRKTMECRKVPGLFFIGEVLDVTGKLGGFNFQWAWASAVAAGRNV